MQYNGFNSSNYRYFYLEQFKDWAGIINLIGEVNT